MTLTQLKYLIAVDTHRRFATAAEVCYISQPSLSMQIQKLEEELGLRLFKRDHYPVVPTSAGEKIIQQARVVLRESERIHKIARHQKDQLQQHLRIAVIPTLAPYLLPFFITDFSRQFPDVKLSVSELPTEDLLDSLKREQVDVGLMVTPSHEDHIEEHPLFYESFVVYLSEEHPFASKSEIGLKEIDLSEVLLVQEVHCIRSQVINLCRDSGEISKHNIDYSAGSLETLKRIVEIKNGVTILPELSTVDFTEKQKKRIRRFKEPSPVREVSLVVNKGHLKNELTEQLAHYIMDSVPDNMKTAESSFIVDR